VQGQGCAYETDAAYWLHRHTVIPDGYRIAATARVISPSGMSPSRASTGNGLSGQGIIGPVSDCR
jgi:hypothetical protein